MDWTETLALYLGTFIVWGFLMAFLFNVALKFMSEEHSSYLVYCSFVLFLSYFSSDHFYSLFDKKEIYLTWFYYDLVTIAFVILPAIVLKIKLKSPIYYLLIFLSLNAVLFLAMHIDIVIYGNNSPWLLWDIYRMCVNMFDFAMIFALIFASDYLGILRFTRYIRNRVSAS